MNHSHENWMPCNVDDRQGDVMLACNILLPALGGLRQEDHFDWEKETGLKKLKGGLS